MKDGMFPVALVSQALATLTAEPDAAPPCVGISVDLERLCITLPPGARNRSLSSILARVGERLDCATTDG
jgi:hypothetical protein